MLVGIDEAGRGPLAGVVVACALYLKRKPQFKVKDSKALSSRARDEAFSWILNNSCFGIGLANRKEIDQLNILQATLLAFNRAVKGLLKKKPQLKKATFIIDGNHFRSDLDLKFRCLKKADQIVAEVSCASVVAKVVRDRLMDCLDFLYPQWKFSQHKGYPTLEHFQLLSKHQLTPFHRRSFGPCQIKV